MGKNIFLLHYIKNILKYFVVKFIFIHFESENQRKRIVKPENEQKI